MLIIHPTRQPSSRKVWRIAEIRGFGNVKLIQGPHPQVFGNACQLGFPVASQATGCIFTYIYLSAKGPSSTLRGGDRSPDLYILSVNIISNLNICSQMLPCPMAHTASSCQ